MGAVVMPSSVENNLFSQSRREREGDWRCVFGERGRVTP